MRSQACAPIFIFNAVRSQSRLQETREFRRAIVEARENSLEILAAQVTADHFAQHRAEVGGELKVAAFI